MPPIEEWKLSGTFTGQTNMLGLVVCALLAGIAMSTMRGEVNTLLSFADQLNKLSMKITGWVIWMSPIGVFSLVVAQVIEMKDFSVLVGKLGLYSFTVIFGVLFQGFVVLPLIYFLVTRKNPFKYLAGVGPALATAFGTASR